MLFTRLMKTWLNKGAGLSAAAWLPTPRRLYEGMPLVRLEFCEGCLIYMTLADRVPRVLQIDQETFKREDHKLSGQGVCGGSPVDFSIEGTILEQYRDEWVAWYEQPEITYTYIDGKIAEIRQAVENKEFVPYQDSLSSWTYFLDFIRYQKEEVLPTCLLLFRMRKSKAFSAECFPVPGMSAYTHDYEKMIRRAKPNDLLEYLGERQQNQSGQYRTLSERFELKDMSQRQVVRKVFTENHLI